MKNLAWFLSALGHRRLLASFSCAFIFSVLLPTAMTTAKTPGRTAVARQINAVASSLNQAILPQTTDNLLFSDPRHELMAKGKKKKGRGRGNPSRGNERRGNSGEGNSAGGRDDSVELNDIVPAALSGWNSTIKAARLVNGNSLVLQLDVLDKPATSYANAVYQVYAYQNGRWRQVYSSVGARLLDNVAGKLGLAPEVIPLDQLRLGSNATLADLALKVVAQVRYDVKGGERDRTVTVEQIYNYRDLVAVDTPQQASTVATNSSTSSPSSQSSSSQSPSSQNTTATIPSAPPATTPARGVQSITLNNGFRISFLGVTYEDNSSIWRYYIEESANSQDLSNWILGLPRCARVAQMTPNGETVNPDPNARISGVKWETNDGFQGGEFAVTLGQRFDVGVTSVAAQGPDVAQGVLPGPSCRTL